MYLVLISVFLGDVRSVGGDVPLDYEAPMVGGSGGWLAAQGGGV